MAQNRPLVIVGGGLAGASAALHLNRLRPDLPLLLLEAGESFGGDHTWSFFDSDVPPGSAWLVAALQPVHWPRHTVHFPARERAFDQGYNSVRSEALDQLVRHSLPEHMRRTGVQVTRLEADQVTLASGEMIPARAVIDARGPMGPMPGLELGWQKFVGIEFAAAAPDPLCATVMDATVPQLDGYRFVYVLPLSAERVLVEDTYYSDGPDLPVEGVAARVRELAAARGLSGAELRQEAGVLPILIDGDPTAFWPADDPVARLGLTGGFFHPTTGYSFRLALQLGEELAQQTGPLDAAQVAGWARARFLRHWREGAFHRMLNRMMYRAGKSDQRYRVLSHFYRLPPALIARFYAGSLTWFDCLRIVSGRPPVPVLPAIRAALGR